MNTQQKKDKSDDTANTQQKRDKADGKVKDEVEELKLKLEQQIAGAIWIQVFGLTVEAVLLQKRYSLNEEYIEAETEELIAVWIQLAGLITEAVGVTQQAYQPTLPYKFEGQRVAITGNLIQSLGAALEAIAGEKILLNEILTEIPNFVE